jgi:hypothetical protein
MRKGEGVCIYCSWKLLHYLVVCKDHCINIEINKIIVYIWGRNL